MVCLIVSVDMCCTHTYGVTILWLINLKPMRNGHEHIKPDRPKKRNKCKQVKVTHLDALAFSLTYPISILVLQS